MIEKKNILIIGGGTGGLITALFLQKNGYKVTIVEKNDRVGGLLQSFKRKGCIFDTGMHYLGALNRGQVMYKIFNYLNILDKVEFKKINEDAHDVFKIAGNIYKYPIGWNNFRNYMVDKFPKESKAIESYISKVVEVSASNDLLNLRTPVTHDFNSSKYLTIGAYDFISGLTNNEELVNVLSVFNSIYAGSKNSTSLYMHAVIHNYYNSSAYKIIGGGEAIALALKEEFEKLGGKIIVNNKIVKFNFKDKKIVSIDSDKGNTFVADNFISNMHPTITAKLIEENVVRKTFKQRFLNLKNTISIFGVHVILEDEIFPSFKYNFHNYTQKDVWAVDYYDKSKWPQEYLIYTPAVKEDKLKSKCFSVYTYMKYEEVIQWENTEIYKRSKEYKEWKEQKALALLNLVEKDFPEINGKVKSMEILTPLSYKDYINNVEGEVYGISHDYNNAFASHVFSRTKVKNLFMTGQSVVMHGLLGVTLGSMLTSSEFLPLNKLIEDINTFEKNDL